MFTISNHMYIEYVWYTHLCILHMWDRKGFRNLPVRVEGWRGDATSLTTSVLNYNLTASVGLKLGALTHIQLCDINVLLKDVMVDCGEVHEQGCLQRRFREFGSTSNQPHNHRPHVTTQAQDLHIQQMHLHDHQNPATRTAAATIGVSHCRWSSGDGRPVLQDEVVGAEVVSWEQIAGTLEEGHLSEETREDVEAAPKPER
ncbi:uncharacterized protein LOC133558766 isoform X2 [Nerophis ophidion]|uniref:uncharacterized protein LOC133558766 isoform X2 n=1 Tax=Nerophis ophidion TaxID=159077 RepID=UPI002ADFD5EE|nr:uncharacterized protein LOC133558766 isoform X2 [Nerophis ophidion]